MFFVADFFFTVSFHFSWFLLHLHAHFIYVHLRGEEMGRTNKPTDDNSENKKCFWVIPRKNDRFLQEKMFLFPSSAFLAGKQNEFNSRSNFIVTKTYGDLWVLQTSLPNYLQDWKLGINNLPWLSASRIKIAHFLTGYIYLLLFPDFYKEIKFVHHPCSYAARGSLIEVVLHEQRAEPEDLQRSLLIWIILWLYCIASCHCRH